MAKIYIPADGECEVLDDIDFMTPARTIRFSLDGIHYEVDLCKTHLEEMRALLEPFIRFSHVVRREDTRRDTTDNRNQALHCEDSWNYEGGSHG